MLIRKIWDHAIDTNEGFVLRKKKKVCLLSREKREEVYLRTRPQT